MNGSEEDTAARRTDLMRRQAASVSHAYNNMEDVFQRQLLPPSHAFPNDYNSSLVSYAAVAESRLPTAISNDFTLGESDPRERFGSPLGYTAATENTSARLPENLQDAPRESLLPDSKPPSQLDYPFEFALSTPRGSNHGVPHVYHDYSQVTDQADYIRNKSGGVSQPFPEKLYEMLESKEVDQSIVSWLPHGRAFVVKLPKRFTKEIMPK
jgi:hypothetical protein